MKTSRFQFEYRDSASSYHRKVGDVLRDSTLFSGQQIYQEYPVNRVNTDYQESSHHFDWVLPGIFLVIEVHGEQHYRPIDFSGKSEDGGIMSFKSIRARDKSKREAAIEAGYTYIVIPYDEIDKVNEDYIWALYKENQNEVQLRQTVREEDPTHRQRLDAARNYRKAAYRRTKERMEVRSRRAPEPSLQGERTGKNRPKKAR